MKYELIEAIRGRAEKATAGPWYTASTTDGPWIIEENGNIISGTCAHVSDGGFIANAREDIPALLAEVERLNGVVGALISTLELIEERTEGQANKLARGAIKYANEEIR